MIFAALGTNEKEARMASRSAVARDATRDHPRRNFWRFLLATFVLVGMYLLLDQVWLWGADTLMRMGWSYDDPARTYAQQGVEVAKQSKAMETRLSPQHPHAVYQLGVEYGYLSRRLGRSGSGPSAPRLASPSVEHEQQALGNAAQFLGIGTIEPLPVRTDIDFLILSQSLEQDAGGVAGRIEQATSLRLRHVFMVGTHIGIELATLESQDDLTPFPPFYLIGMHATLAGLPEPIWRPLTRLPRGDMKSRLAHYRAAEKALDVSLMQRE
jgi:hypothetical protein